MTTTTVPKTMMMNDLVLTLVVTVYFFGYCLIIFVSFPVPLLIVFATVFVSSLSPPPPIVVVEL